MLNFKGKDAEKFEREWQEGCSKLGELVKNGRMEKTEAEKLAEGSRIVIGRTKFSSEKKEVLRKMLLRWDSPLNKLPNLPIFLLPKLKHLWQLSK